MPALTDAEMNAYLRRLAPPRRAAGGFEALETTSAVPTDAQIQDRAARTRDALLDLLDRYFGPDPDRKAKVDELVRQGGEGLRMLANRDAAALGSNAGAAAGLEAIVRTDGSRPSFLIKEGDIDFASSPIGSWEQPLKSRAAALQRAISCVGRVDLPGVPLGYEGTGFLVGPDVILTNRHVLQLVADPQADGSWKLKPGAAIDFGHELQGRASVNRRALKAVVFWGSREIVFTDIDHTKLDLALIELEPLPGGGPPPFAVQSAVPTTAGQTIVTVGYPGPPPFLTYPETLLDQLFARSYGFKRLAPGEPIPTTASTVPWTLAHDATTLGGNSGSVVFALDREGTAVGLHYGGRPSGPAENWSHRLDLVLGQTTPGVTATLGETLRKYGVTFTGPAPETPAAPPSPTAGVTTRPNRPTTLRDMVRLGGGGAAEAPGDGETPAAAFAGRGGYDPNFLPGFPVPLPLARGSAAADMRRLRDNSGVELKYQHFSVIVSASRRMPMVTACNIDGSQSRSLPRQTQWNFDGRLLREHQFGNEIYQGRDNPLDRGHMVRREDPVWGPVAAQANADTFHYTNSCPQMAVINQQVWAGLENYVLSHTKQDRMQVSVFTGPFFTDGDLEFRGARVPLSFWKVVAFLLPDGRPSATAYRVSQERELQELEFVFAGYKTFQISVRQVADGTGLDFSALIPFDGFSHHEATTGQTLAERIDRPDQIRV